MPGTGTDQAGRRMSRLVAAISADADESTQVRLRRNADALASYARSLGTSLLVPVSPSGRLLTGAALVLHGDLLLHPPGGEAEGKGVLLVDGITTSWFDVDRHAAHLCRAGAGAVHAFAVSADGEPGGLVDGHTLAGGHACHRHPAGRVLTGSG